jgi:guanine deaminase
MGQKDWMRQAVALAVENARSGGGPFGALIIKDGQVIATGVNRVTATNDPTAHAEIVAIREACRVAGSFQLTGCTIYSSCEPCPMCLGAIFWARPDAYYFAATREDAARAGFDDEHIYTEMNVKPEERSVRGHRIELDAGAEPFIEWARNPNKQSY